MQHFLKTTLAVGAFALTLGMAQAQDLAPLNSDSEPDRMDWSELDAKFGAMPGPDPRNLRGKPFQVITPSDALTSGSVLP